jgi:hypothetical protein
MFTDITLMVFRNGVKFNQSKNVLQNSSSTKIRISQSVHGSIRNEKCPSIYVTTTYRSGVRDGAGG